MSARVLRELPLTMSAEDHAAVIVSVKVQPTSGKVLLPRQRPGYSREYIKDKDKMAAFLAAVRSIPAVSWDCEAQSHLAYLNHMVLCVMDY